MNKFPHSVKRLKQHNQALGKNCGPSDRISLVGFPNMNEQCLLGTTTNTWSTKYERSESLYTRKIAPSLAIPLRYGLHPPRASAECSHCIPNPDTIESAFQERDAPQVAPKAAAKGYEVNKRRMEEKSREFLGPFKRELDALRIWLTLHRATLAPTRRLPSDILLIIFQVYVEFD